MATTVTIDERLLQQAVRVTGIERKDDVVREALTALIQRETARPHQGDDLRGHAVADDSIEHTGLLVRALDRIDDLARLGNDWDSYGAAPIGTDAVRTARVLAIELWRSGAFADLSQIDIIPIPTGGIQFEWALGGGEIEVEIDRTGELTWLIARDDGIDEESSGQPAASPRDVVDRISSFTH